jgi:DNA-directed RNA polymerase subunit omega
VRCAVAFGAVQTAECADATMPPLYKSVGGTIYICQVARTVCRPSKGASMARITVEDCQQRVDNRFLLVQMAIKRVRQYRDEYEALIDSHNKEIVTALREIAAGKVLPTDKSMYSYLPEGQPIPNTEG